MIAKRRRLSLFVVSATHMQGLQRFAGDSNPLSPAKRQSLFAGKLCKVHIQAFMSRASICTSARRVAYLKVSTTLAWRRPCPRTASSKGWSAPGCPMVPAEVPFWSRLGACPRAAGSLTALNSSTCSITYVQHSHHKLIGCPPMIACVDSRSRFWMVQWYL